MRLERKILTSKQQVVDIMSEDDLICNHFLNSNNYADIVLNQLNQDRFYDPIFEGEENLTILDIGGNIGLFSLYVHDCADKVYSVEPTPDHFRILQELTANYPNIQPINIALHNSDTTLDFFISEENSTMNSSVNQYGKKIQVEGMTLKSLIDKLGLEHVDFVKCDIEGSEMVALTEETIAPVKDIIDSWFIEVHATDNEYLKGIDSLRANKATLKSIFEKLGYGVQELREDALYVYKD
jgi:FkbM family methyltransferase